MEYIMFNNKKYTKDKKSGYYLNSATHKRLHRAVWEYYNGKIPENYEIHHKDHNKDNNNIENLMLVEKNEHKKIHARELTEEEREKRRNNLKSNARPKAIEWHKSEVGREWHKEQYQKTLALAQEQEFTCINCGKVYKAIKKGANKYCSNNCKSKYRRKIKKDDIERKCEVCGQEFTTNKYSKRKYCSICKNKKH